MVRGNKRIKDGETSGRALDPSSPKRRRSGRGKVKDGLDLDLTVMQVEQVAKQQSS